MFGLTLCVRNEIGSFYYHQLFWLIKNKEGSIYVIYKYIFSTTSDTISVVFIEQFGLAHLRLWRTHRIVTDYLIFTELVIRLIWVETQCVSVCKAVCAIGKYSFPQVKKKLLVKGHNDTIISENSKTKRKVFIFIYGYIFSTTFNTISVEFIDQLGLAYVRIWRTHRLVTDYFVVMASAPRPIVQASSSELVVKSHL